MSEIKELPSSKVFIDSTVLTKAEAMKPQYLSRTAWINQLVDLGCLAVQQRSASVGDD